MANPGTSDPKPAGRLTPDRNQHQRARREAPDLNFWAVFESAPDAYLLLAPDPPRFTMVAANDTRLRVTLTRREDVIGRPLFELFPDNPADPGATGATNLQASLDEVLRTGKPHRMALQKYDIRTRDGSFDERYWDPLNAPVFDERGNLIYILHRVEDVTEQVRSGRRLEEIESILERNKRTEQELRESEARYRLLADLIPQHIWTTDPNGYHRYFSRRWYDFTGATLQETEGDRWLRFIHPDDRERTLERWHHSLRTGEAYSIEYRFRGADGDYRWFLGQALPQRDDSGAIVGWFGTLTDISERKRLDEERERLLAREREARAQAEERRAELERVSESRTRLMRGFTHDVKNPLGAADGYAQLLEAGLLGELSTKQVESVQGIRRSLQRSLHLINELLELARAEAGQIELEAVHTDVAELVRETAEEFRAQAAAAGLELQIGPARPLVSRTDPARVRQILGNLLANAVKYTPEGRIAVQVGLGHPAGVARDDECIAIRVSDTGPGIPPARQELIFHEFTRLDPEAQHGAGVGLAISRRIARLLGGDITVQSNVDRGSTFTLWLPPRTSE